MKGYNKLRKANLAQAINWCSKGSMNFYKTQKIMSYCRKNAVNDFNVQLVHFEWLNAQVQFFNHLKMKIEQVEGDQKLKFQLKLLEQHFLLEQELNKLYK